MKETKWIKENMASFKEYEPLVRKWCKKHKMAWVMPEFKELFDKIRIMDEVREERKTGKKDGNE